ncbi:hypothetical protein BZL30_6360 [Mycobacterium kansasii]|uniref:Uncharacterized protein n=1 Tax=Mycobacterium kansasii TaxID=1768 RepID=A0A1V3WU85_MYCKA|nr:hypothetical protein BZL30_6360 [Mycobacterium kansasii]OOK75063.1 hypothetical protein BZL29_4384 [Mycobacterium kansasii]
MTVVHVVDVITVRNRDMPTSMPMRMVVPHMLLVSYSVHLVLLATDSTACRCWSATAALP